VDIALRFDDEHVASIVLDDVQDSYPWYTGRIVDGPTMPRWRDLVEVFSLADLELDYCPHHPHEGPYEDTDLATYVAELVAYQRDRRAGNSVWTPDWDVLNDHRLAALVGFVDYRRWKAVNRAGEIIEGVPLPPGLDLQSRKFAFRP
jgi:hypothetical protein